MTQMMDLNKMGLEPTIQSEMLQIDGGSFLSWIPLLPAALATFVISNWSDIKKGFSDGLQLK